MPAADDVTVIIPTIPPRRQMLKRAVHSALMQSWAPAAIHIELDTHHAGSAATRNRALEAVRTEWVAFLDDDDVLLPNHLEVLCKAADAYAADVVYPWPQMNGAPDPSPDRFGLPFDEDLLRVRSYIPVTSLVETELAQAAQFWAPDGSVYDDWGFYLRLLDLGATFHHVPERTWIWNVGTHNTSGQPDRW